MLNDLATTDVVLRDGSTVCVRQVTVEGDVDTLREFLISLSSESLYFRFLGICALTRDRGQGARRQSRRHARSPPSRAGGLWPSPVSIAIRRMATVRRSHSRSPMRCRGTGSAPGCWNTWRAWPASRGSETFDAYVLAGNRRMLDVFRDSGFAMTTVHERGVLQVSLSLSVTPAFEAKAATRSQAAATASMKAFFEPRVVAVIGANRERGQDRLRDSPQPGDGRIPRTHRAGAPDGR